MQRIHHQEGDDGSRCLRWVEPRRGQGDVNPPNELPFRLGSPQTSRGKNPGAGQHRRYLQDFTTTETVDGIGHHVVPLEGASACPLRVAQEKSKSAFKNRGPLTTTL